MQRIVACAPPFFPVSCLYIKRADYSDLSSAHSGIPSAEIQGVRSKRIVLSPPPFVVDGFELMLFVFSCLSVLLSVLSLSPP